MIYNKKIILGLFLSANLFITSSCGDWLNVSPIDEVSNESLYSNHKGYYNVLNGIYLDLGSVELYGNNLSWGGTDAWGRVNTLKEGFTQHESLLSLYQFNYEHKGAVSFAQSIWQNMYKNIARTNEFIQSCSKRNPEFFPNGEPEYKLLLGEATALRAMMHFDILRMFAQSPAKESALSESYIPYVVKYPSIVNPKQTTSEVLDLIESDLHFAAEHVAAYDTIEANKKFVLESGNRFSPQMKPDAGVFFSQRGSRLNYYAIKLLQARVSMYRGNSEKALEHSNELYSLISSGKLKLMSPSNIKNGPKMMDEVLFGYYNSKLTDVTKNWFLFSMQQVLKINDLSNFNKLTNDKRRDILENGILNIYSEGKNTETSKNYIPNLKLSELYYIRAEALANQGQLAEAITLFNNFIKSARGLTKVNEQIPLSASKEEFLDYLINDMRKEFAGTGQIIYFYKRLNIPVRSSSGSDLSTVSKMVMPVPQSEDAI